MKDATGSSLLLYLIIIIVGIIGSIITVTNMYSRSYKAKNAIINTIDQYNLVSGEDCLNAPVCIKKIKDTLADLNYRLKIDNPCGSNRVLSKYSDKTNKVNLVYPAETDTFEGFCIFKIADGADFYYSVVTFSYLDIALIGNLYNTPVYGETKTY